MQGVIEPRIGAEGRRFGTGFELRMPADWSGRFVFQGGGGWDGQVDPALGIIDRTRPEDTNPGSGSSAFQGRREAGLRGPAVRLD